MRRLVLILSVLVVLSPLAAHAAPVTTSPGKTSVSSSESSTLNMSGNVTGLMGTISKGAKKRILQFTATLSIVDDMTVPAISLFPTVNGFIVTGTSQNYQKCDTSEASNCTLTAVYWLDLDAAELAHPGTYIGQPLNIGIFGGSASFTGSGLNYNLSFNATMVKK